MKILDAVSIHGIATLASAHVKLMGFHREYSQNFLAITYKQAQGNVSFLNSIKNLILFSFQVIYIIYDLHNIH